MQNHIPTMKKRNLALTLLAIVIPITSIAGVIPLTVAGGNTPQLFSGKAPAPNAITCGFTNSQNLAYGNYDPFSATADTASGTFTVTCSSNDTVTITFSTGNSGTYSNRYMTTTTTDHLNYNIYGDAAHTILIGNGTNGTSYYEGTVGTGGGIGTFYGLAPASQNIGPGNYSDTIIMTLTF